MKHMWDQPFILTVLICGLLFFYRSTYGKATSKAEYVILKVILNEEDKGTQFLRLTTDNDVLVSIGTWNEWGLRDTPLPVVVDGESYVSLKSLAPEVQFVIDEKVSALQITADPHLFPIQHIDLSYQQPRQVDRLAQNAAYLNYNLQFSLEDDLNFKFLSIPWETVIRIDRYLGFSSFSYIKNKQDERLVRLLSNITIDDPQTLRRFILGDFVATSGVSGGSGLFGGINIAKNFTMAPYLVRFPELVLSGVVQTPSQAEVFINDQLQGKETLPPGEFTIVNIPAPSGGGRTTLAIVDAYGETRFVTDSFYLSSLLLKPGLHEYSYSLGFRREALGQKSFKYGDLAFAGFHRMGLSRTVTGGLQAEWDKHIINIGLTGNWLLRTFGEMQTTLAFGHNNGQFGFRALVGYSYAGQFVNLNLAFEHTSRNFASIFTGESQVRLRGAASVGVNFRRLGAITVTYAALDRYQDADTRLFSLFYRRQVARNLSLFVSATRTEGDSSRNEVFGSLNEVFVGLSAFWGHNKFASLSSQVRDGQTVTSASLQKSPPFGTGIGYRSELDVEDENVVGGFVQGQYRSPYGIFVMDYGRDKTGQNTYGLNILGSMTFIDKHFLLSRPISDSFALVKVSDLKGVRVLYNNQVVGITNQKGELLVPELTSYLDNKLSLEFEDLPLEYQIPERTTHVSTPFRSGGIVAFGIEKRRAYEGHLFFVENGRQIPAEFAGLELIVNGDAMVNIVGKGGTFYLENVPSGTFSARLFTEDKQCHFDMTIPVSDEALTNMGDITCEIR